MPRLCACDRTVTDGSPWVRGRDCPRCWLWHNHPASRAAMEGQAAAPVAATPDTPLPACLHLGGPAPPPPNRDVRKEWHRCGAGKGAVCRCDCGPRCDQYEPEGDPVEAQARRPAAS